MSTPAELAVRLAAAMLPRDKRDRYREQWLGELRDAAEAGLRASDIALGSLVFAITVDRPPVARGRLSPEAAARRGSLAAGLALASAAVSVTRYADLVGVGGLTGDAGYDFALFLGGSLLSAFLVIAPVVSVVLVVATRGTPSRVRTAVLLLTLASLAPTAQAAIDGVRGAVDVFSSVGASVYAVAVVLVVAALALLARERSSVAPRGVGAAPARRIVASVLGGAAVVGLTGVFALDAAAVWAGRPPLEFGGDASGYANWAALEDQGVDVVATVLVWFVIGGIVAAFSVVVVGVLPRSTVGGIVVAALVAASLLVVGYAAVVGFVTLMAPGVVVTIAVEPVMMAARWVLVALVLITVGGVRPTRRRASAREVARAV